MRQSRSAWIIDGIGAVVINYIEGILLFVIDQEAAQLAEKWRIDFVILFILPTGGFCGMIHHGVLYNN